MGGFKRAPEKVFMVHGEPGAQEALKDKIVEKFGWRPDTVEIPEYLEKFEL
jgi:Cft2 family RNA processing exonuclease